MTMIPFNGFFYATATEAATLKATRDWVASLGEKYASNFEYGVINEEGRYSEDREFRALVAKRESEERTEIKKSFLGQGLAKPGTLVQVKALPGGSQYRQYGGKVRTYILGGTLNSTLVSDHDIASDDFVIGYENLLLRSAPS